MATYIGYFHPAGTSPVEEVFRDTGAPPRAFADKVNAFVTSLPASCKWIGTWNVAGDAPSTIVVETDNVADLQHINNYYFGWLSFTWHPATAPARDN